MTVSRIHKAIYATMGLFFAGSITTHIYARSVEIPRIDRALETEGYLTTDRKREVKGLLFDCQYELQDSNPDTQKVNGFLDEAEALTVGYPLLEDKLSRAHNAMNEDTGKPYRRKTIDDVYTVLQQTKSEARTPRSKELVEERDSWEMAPIGVYVPIIPLLFLLPLTAGREQKSYKAAEQQS
jgi:hypothetical protein